MSRARPRPATTIRDHHTSTQRRGDTRRINPISSSCPLAESRTVPLIAKYTSGSVPYFECLASMPAQRIRVLRRSLVSWAVGFSVNSTIVRRVAPTSPHANHAPIALLHAMQSLGAITSTAVVSAARRALSTEVTSAVLALQAGLAIRHATANSRSVRRVIAASDFSSANVPTCRMSALRRSRLANVAKPRLVVPVRRTVVSSSAPARKGSLRDGTVPGDRPRGYSGTKSVVVANMTRCIREVAPSLVVARRR